MKSGSSRISLQQVSCSHRSRRRVAAGGARAEYRILVHRGFRCSRSPARADPIDEWLQVALALSIEIFLESPPRPGGHSRKAGCLNGSIRGSQDESGRRARPAHRWLNGEHSPYPRRLRRRTEDREGSIPPDDAVNEACRRR